MSRRRVVLTGLGAVTPLGLGAEPSWQALCQGRSGIGPVTRFDPTSFRCQIAAEVKEFHPEDFFADRRLMNRLDRFIHFQVAAGRMAVEDAGLKIGASNEDRVGVVMGTAVGAVANFEAAHTLVLGGSPDRVSPFFVVNVTPNMGAGVVALQFGARGPHHCLCDACATGTNCLGLGLRLIQYGEADAVIAGGAESGITPTFFAGLDSIGATTHRRDKASRPFDRLRDGFVSGEGGAALVMEELGYALRRGARIYAEVIGYGSNAEAFHITHPQPDGEYVARCMMLALKDAGITPQEVDYINAHGTSTIANDVAESRGIKRVFGEHARKLAVSSNKSMIGHTWGAAGAIEAVFSVLAIRDRIIPPTINYEEPDPECDLDYVPNVARQARVRIAMSNSFGFGGINGVLLFGAFSPDPKG